MTYSDHLSTLLRPKSGAKPLVLDLFAGCGGLALGFEAQGFQTLGFEMDADCCATYRHNLHGDCLQIKLTPDYVFPKAQVVIGGPPCQPFSVGGHQNGIRDARDGFPAFISAVEQAKPDIWMFENVRRLMYRNKDYLDAVIAELDVLQKDIIERFLAIFGFEAEVLYVGDTSSKFLFVNRQKLTEIKFFELAHDQLPDVIAYSEKKNWLYLVETVTTANPITELRRRTLLELTRDCTADVIFITAFPDRATYRKFAKDIAWETEVWIADAPEHMIHFNGNKFLGPYV